MVWVVHARTPMPQRPSIGLAAVAALLFTGCLATGDVFKNGVWVGVIGFLLTLAVTGGLVTLLSRR